MENASISDRSGRIHSLDGLRAFSIVLVLVGHLAGTAGSPQFLAGVHSLGNYGVRFFFVISGFLITWLLLNELDRTGTVNLRKFFANRVLRIFPAFYAYVGIGAVLGAYGVVELLPGDLLHAATYTMNYHDERAWHLNHTWSLAVEEQFYLIWPFVFLALGRRYAPVVLLASIFLVPCVRAVMWLGFEMSPTAMMRQFQAVADSLALGCLMAFAFRSGCLPILRGSLQRLSAWLLASSLLAGSAGLYLVAPAAFYVAGQSLANLGAALAVYLCITSKDGILYRVLNSRIAVFVGTLSYSLYLWQEPFLNSTVADFPQSYPVNLFFTLVAALASYFLVERPFLRLKDRKPGWRWPMRPMRLLSLRKGFRAALLCLMLGGGTFLAAGDLHSLSNPTSIRVSAEEVHGLFDEQSVLSVVGRNGEEGAVTIVVRVDDKPSPTYRDRVNIERQVLPGGFELEIPLGGLRTHTGRALRPENIREVRVFPGRRSASVSLEQAVIETPNLLPAGSMGWDFGPSHAAVFPGFTKIDPTAAGAFGKKMTGLKRPAGDALISDGIRGLERFEAEVPDGIWRVTLWTEDPGEWQTLPYWTRRSIRINGKPISAEAKTAKAWFLETYMRGARAEAVIDGDLWDLTAGRRGGLVSGEIEVVGGRLVIEVDGDLSTARYIAGLLLEPATGSTAKQQVQEYRRRVFDNTWRVVEPLTAEDPPSLSAFTAQEPRTSGPVEGLQGRLARGDSRSWDVWLSAPPEDQVVGISFEPASNWPDGLSVELRQGIWGFGRTSPSGTVVQARADRLSDTTDRVRLTAGLRRRLSIRAVSASNTPAGSYLGRIVIGHRAGNAVIPVTLSILDLQLPAANRSIGVYLEEAPHLSWFGPFAGSRSEAAGCDLALLRRFGLTAVAPPFSLPEGDFRERHTDMAKRVRQNRFDAPLVSYASFKWTVKRDGLKEAAARAGAVTRDLAGLDLGPILWSIADEPSNFANGHDGLKEVVSVFRSTAPDAKLLGHLNSKRDRQVLKLFDTVLVNPGFGVDRDDIDEIRKKGVSPWFYNMGNPRAAAGFYLWRAGADGYLQWHARMPTADPFDPTDGREDDFQFLYPSLDPCNASEIHEDLIEFSNGIADLRWMLWLEGRAENDPDAKRLIDELKSDLPTRWRRAAELDDTRLNALRARIVAFAAASLRAGRMQNAASN